MGASGGLFGTSWVYEWVQGAKALQNFKIFGTTCSMLAVILNSNGFWRGPTGILFIEHLNQMNNNHVPERVESTYQFPIGLDTKISKEKGRKEGRNPIEESPSYTAEGP